MFGDPVVATAILDRLLHHSTVITIRGDSYRLREKRRSGLLQKAGPAPQTNETVTPSFIVNAMRGGSVLQLAQGVKMFGWLDKGKPGRDPNWLPADRGSAVSRLQPARFHKAASPLLAMKALSVIARHKWSSAVFWAAPSGPSFTVVGIALAA